MSDATRAGLLVVDKPAGRTSHDVVDKVREVLSVRAGHAGTLDPQATGVLLVCVGRATRLARFLQGHDKVYEGIIRLGWATDTYDAEGEPTTERVSPPPLSNDEVGRALRSFVGKIEQIPPVYSAKKVRGQPAYRRARRGELVEPEPVEVVVYEAELLGLRDDEIDVRIHCGAGTYVRTLAQDLGSALGCPAHLAGLRRTRSGPFDLGDAVGWDDLARLSAAQIDDLVVPPASMLPDWPAAVVNAEGAAAVRSGGMVEAGWITERRPGSEGDRVVTGKNGWVRVLDEEGEMLAAGEMVPGGLVQPRVVIG